MAKHDYVIDNASGQGVREEINLALQAIVSNNSSSSEPSPRFAYMYWIDTANHVIKLRNGDDDAWIDLRNLDGSFPFSLEVSGAKPRVKFSETNFSPFILIQDNGSFDLRHHLRSNTNIALRVTPNNLTTAATEYALALDATRVTIGKGLKVDGTFDDGQTSEIVVSGASPQILLEDTDSNAHDFYIQVNENNFYILRDSDGGSGDWSDDGNFPLQLEGDTNDAYVFGRRIIDNGEFSVNNGGTFATTSLATDAELKLKVERSDATKGHAILGIRQVGTYSAGANVPVGFVRLSVGSETVPFQGIVDRNLFVGTDNNLRIATTAANIGGTGGVIVGDQSSDIRLKTLLDSPVPGLSKIKELNPIRFTYNNFSEERLGFSAQDVASALPESVYDTGDPIPGETDDAATMLDMRYTEIVPVLVNAVKELSTQVEALTARIAALESA